MKPTPTARHTRLQACARVAAGLGLSLLAASPTSWADQPSCQPGPATTVSTPPPARAAWLDGSRLRWPVAADGARFALYHAAGRALSAPVGGRVLGADGRQALRLVAANPEAAGPGRFSHIGAGVTLQLPTAARARLASWLRGELLLVREDERGRVLDSSHVQHAGALDALYAQAAEGQRLGAWVERSGTRAVRTHWRLWAPTAQRVSLCLDSEQGPRRFAMQRDAASGAWHVQRAGDLSGRAYRYAVDVHLPGHGRVHNLVTDPYSLGLTAESARSVVLDLDSPALAPPGWRDTPRPQRVQAATDLVIYELHVRDFSIGDASVAPAHRGKYLAFTDSSSEGMRHLRALADAGLTDVHLLPVFDFATVPDRGAVTPQPAAGAPDGESQQASVMAGAANDGFNWGYDPWHFTAPEGSYATDPDDAAGRVREFRQMVLALHRAGLRVGMDVVYNHMSASGQHAHSVLDRIVPGYYHRLDAQGVVERSTCCDNTATEHRMMAKLMIDSAVVWARDHHIDSFRFDLMGHQPREAMERLQKAVNQAAGRHIHLIGEGWNFGEVADGRRFVQASQLSLGGSGIATFSDRARDAVRGGGAGDDGAAQIKRQGVVSGLHLAPNAIAGDPGREALLAQTDLVRAGLAGSLRDYSMLTWRGEKRTLAQIDYAGQPAGYVVEPGEVVNYVENHDNQTLYDAFVFKLPAGTSVEERARAQHLASALVLFSQGIAYVHAGQELLRSKSMDRNSYDSGDWFNRLDWSLRDNGFGVGLPPQRDNGDSWPWMKPLLADPTIKPTPADIRWTRDAFLDLLRIRASSSLLRLRSAADIQARLRLHNTGPEQVAGVLVGEIDGQDYPGAGHRSLVYLVNVAPTPQQLVLPALRGQALVLHPVHRSLQAADRRAAEARFDPEQASFHLPARTAVVFVQ